jgi:hypothetical protein
MPQIVVLCEPRNVDDLNRFFHGRLPHDGIVHVDIASTRDATVKKTGHSKRTIILGNQNQQRRLERTDALYLGTERFRAGAAGGGASVLEQA